MTSQQAFEWQFGGWHGFSPWLGWLILCAVAATGVALAVWFYRDTLQTLNFRQRAIFISLRAGFFIALLLCLAGPSRVVRTYDSGDETRPLAVVVDRSASMMTPDTSGLSRLTAAVRIWKASEAAAIHAFPSLHYFHFSSRLTPDADLQHAVDADDPGTDTALFNSLDQALQSAPAGGYGGIVCLTDGLDTTQAASDPLVARALQTRTPLYFVVGENRQALHEDLIVRETVTPEHVLRKSEFNATVLVEAHSSHERDVPLILTQDDKALAETTIHLRAGLNLIPWSVPVHSDEPALIHLNWRLGDEADQESIAATVPVLTKNQVNVLFYQGSLDWGFRFINTALQRDASFLVTGLFNPDLDIANTAPSSPAPGSPDTAPAMTALPDTAAALQSYQIVVLANAFAEQMTEPQQKAIADYVKQGGGLLFLVADTKVAQTFSGTVLESMLPVIFDPPPPAGQPDDSLEEFQSMMQRIGGANAGSENDFAAGIQAQPGPDPLKAFALPAGTSRQDVAQLFGAPPGDSAAEVPMFSNYAHVAALKAGAEALAVHPEDKTPSNEARVLLATQRFGQGHATALLTDALWRWKLSLPSTSHTPEKFWQQLFLALAGPAGSMHFSKRPNYASLGEHCSFSVDGSPGLSGPVVTAISPASGSQPQAVAIQAGTHTGEWVFQVNADAPGKWRIQVRDSAGAEIESLLRVSNVAHTAELSGLSPDFEGLRKLAQLTGGSVLNEGTPDGWAGRTSTPEIAVVSEHVHPLWNTWPVLLIALGFYAVELIWRRRAKLL